MKTAKKKNRQKIYTMKAAAEMLTMAYSRVADICQALDLGQLTESKNGAPRYRILWESDLQRIEANRRRMGRPPRVSPEVASQIVQARERGDKLTAIARRHNISESMASLVARGKR